jgi:hypothetical protein
MPAQAGVSYQPHANFEPGLRADRILCYSPFEMRYSTSSPERAGRHRPTPETPKPSAPQRASLAVRRSIYGMLPIGTARRAKSSASSARSMPWRPGGPPAVLQPAELWAASGRLETYDPPLTVKDRRERSSPSLHGGGSDHRAFSSGCSYRELPVLAYRSEQVSNDGANGA